MDACERRHPDTSVVYLPYVRAVSFRYGEYYCQRTLLQLVEELSREWVLQILGKYGYAAAPINRDIDLVLREDDAEPEEVKQEHPLVPFCCCDDRKSLKKANPGLVRYYVQLISALEGVKYSDPLEDHTADCVWHNISMRDEIIDRTGEDPTYSGK